jgi:tryptophan-rich sensory protein
MGSRISPRVWALIGFLVATFAAGAIGSAATFPNVQTWYPTLQRPAWTPPNFLFGPVWTTLYIAMAVAGWRAWRSAAPAARRSVITLYGTQLTLNALWSVLFFGLKRPDLALVEIFVLWTVLMWAGLRFARLDRIAGWLWLPYVAWVTFAAALNGAIWYLNRTAAPAGA